MGFPPQRKKRKLPHEDEAVGPDRQGIDQLHDVVSVSGVNLAEQESMMLLHRFAPQKLAFQEKEEVLVLEKNVLRKKMAGITGRWGLRMGSEKDVERCLSMCVEERMRGIICDSIRESKQRVDLEKSRHSITVDTSDVRQEIMVLNKRAREESQAAAAQRAQEIGEADGAKDKLDDGNDKVRRIRVETNLAARAALGGDDILAKWQLKVDQLAQQKLMSNVGAEKRAGVQADSVSEAGSAVGKSGRHAEAIMMMPQTRVASMRSITVKDVIAVLEKEPQMSKSTLMYSLMNATKPV